MKNMLNLSDRTLIVLLVLLQLAVCLPFISSFPIALDEPFSIFWAQQDVGEMVTALNQGNNSPLHFLLLNFWERIFGISPLAVRSLSLLLSMATIPLLFALARKVLARDFAALVVGVFIFSRFNHFHAMEARMYSLLVLESTACLLLLYELIFENKIRPFLLVLTFTTLLYTHYLGIIVIGSGALVSVIFWKHIDRKIWGKLVLSFLFSAVLFYPGLVVLITRFQEGAASSWVPEAQYSELYGNIIRFFNNTISFLVISGILLVSLMLKTGMKLRTLFTGLLGARQTFFLLCFLVPYLGMFIYSRLISPIFLDRYLLFTSIPLYLYFGVLAMHCIDLRHKFVLVPALIVILASSVDFVPDVNRQPDLIASKVRELKTSGSAILIAPPYYDLTFLYHYNRTYFSNYSNKGTYNGGEIIMGVYHFSDFVPTESIHKIIVVDDNSDLVYPENNVFKDASEWGVSEFEQNYAGGTRLGSFLKRK